MSRLSYLLLNDNQLVSDIPAVLGKLEKLFELNVANNHLEGHIPPNISSCTALNRFNVYGNKLNGTIPSGLQNLEFLTYLNLSSNNFKGRIPVELGRIVNDRLDVSFNKISSKIQNINSLILNNNDLHGEIPAQLTNCFSLVNLNLSYNNLSGHIPPTKNLSYGCQLLLRTLKPINYTQLVASSEVKQQKKPHSQRGNNSSSQEL